MNVLPECMIGPSEPCEAFTRLRNEGDRLLADARKDAAEITRLTRLNELLAVMMPWDRVELRGWSIVGMNHYRVNGERRLFVAMADSRGRCVKAEDRNEAEVFKSLARQVFNYHSATETKGEPT